MSRRNQTRRRRTYGRRQHEVRERRPSDARAEAWSDLTPDTIDAWLTDAVDDGAQDALREYGR